MSYLFDTCPIIWASALVPHHICRCVLQYFGMAPWRRFICFNTCSILWAGALAPFDTCSICIPCVGPATWRNLIFVDTCSILWDGAMVQFHMFNTFSILWRPGAVSYLCHMLSILEARRLGAISYTFDTFPYFGPGPWRSFIHFRYFFNTLSRGHNAVSYFSDTFSILWAGAVAQFHNCSILVPYFGLGL
jgi:hypothetical protein